MRVALLLNLAVAICVGGADSLHAGKKIRLRVHRLPKRPAVLTVVVWKYVPLTWGSAMAFLDFRIMTTSTWVGLIYFTMVQLRVLKRMEFTTAGDTA